MLGRGRLTRLACALALPACGFSGAAAPNDGKPIDAPPVTDDAGHEIATWTFQTTSDFALGTFADMGTEPWGALTPAAYVPGGLVMRGANVALWTAETDDQHLTWDATVAQQPAGTGVWRGDDLDNTPPLSQFGVTGAPPFSLWADGELYLEEGVHQFSIDANDVAFLDVRAPGAADYARVVAARYTTGPQTGTFTVASGAAGWYPVRLGYEQNGNTQTLRVTHAAPGGALATLDRGRVRGRGDGAIGLERTVFDQQILATSREQIAIDREDFIAAPTLQHPGVTGDNSNWSARWTGQVYIDTPGAYELTVTSDNGNHVIAGGLNDSSHFTRKDEQAVCTSVVAPTFAKGWQQVLVDYNQSTGGANLSVQFTQAPDPALVGHVLNQAKLRPVETSAARLISRVIPGLNQQIPDNSPTGVSFPLTVSAYAGELANIVDVTVHANSGHWNDLAIALTAPSGAQTDVCTAGNCDAIMHDGYAQKTISAGAVTGTAAAGSWTVTVSDPSHSGGGNVNDVYLTLRTSGGIDTIARHAVWESNVLDLGARPALNLISVAYTTAGAPTSGAALRMRACASATCDGVAWSDPIPDGTLPTLALPAQYLQLQVTIDTDGELELDVPKVEVMFRRPAM